MKNKVLTIVFLGLVVITLLIGCGKKVECDFCGDKAKCTSKTIDGEKLFICNNCAEELKELEHEFNEDDTIFDDDIEKVDNSLGQENKELNYAEENIYDNLMPIDVYSGIELIYSGANGHGTVRFDNWLKDVEFSVGDFYFKPASYEPYQLQGYDVLDVIFNNKKICTIGYDIIDMFDLDDTLSEGDKIKLRVKTYPEKAFEGLGFKPTYYKEVIVPALGEYLTSKKQITADIINQLCTEENLGDDFYRRNIKFDQAYLVKAKPEIEIEGNSPYSIVTIYNAYTNHGKTEYFISKFDDVVIKDDGTISFNDIDTHVNNEDFFGWGGVSYFATLEEACFEVENNFDSQFTVEKIDF